MTTSDNIVHVSHVGHVARILLQRPPHNFIDASTIEAIADALEAQDRENNIRAIVLASEGKSFCAGANLGQPTPSGRRDPRALYKHAMRLYRTRKPIVAAVHGAAVGAGMGLALIADFRVTCEEARFSVNFNRLGFHPGFGLSFTLPRLLGQQQASLLFYTGRRINGAEATRIGLADQLVPSLEVQEAAMILATEIAASAPLAVESTRATLRQGLADEITAANLHELAEQGLHFATNDFREGVAAMADRRLPNFTRT